MWLHFMHRAAWTAAVAGGLVLGTAGMAGAASESQAGRYTMQQTDEGMLRLDTLTGVVSICARRDGRWSCEEINDDNQATDEQLHDLASENRRLRKENQRLRAELNERPLNNTPGTSPRRALPSEEDVDKALSFLDKMLKKFKGIVEDLSETSPDGTPL